jgi:hypothetical protein
MEVCGELEGLTQFLLGLENLSDALGLIRRHLQARLAAAESGSEKVDENEIPPSPSSAEASGKADSRDIPSVTSSISVRISGPRKEIIRENAANSAHDSMSEYLRHMALGWDRNHGIVAQCDKVARWMVKCLGESSGESSEDTIEQGQWEKLERHFERHHNVFLFGSTGEKDPQEILRRGTQHLLGSSVQQVVEETGFSI